MEKLSEALFMIHVTPEKQISILNESEGLLLEISEELIKQTAVAPEEKFITHEPMHQLVRAIDEGTDNPTGSNILAITVEDGVYYECFTIYLRTDLSEVSEDDFLKILAELSPEAALDHALRFDYMTEENFEEEDVEIWELAFTAEIYSK